MVHVVATLRPRVDEPREPSILPVHKRPEVVAFVTDGDTGGRRGTLPAELDVHVRVGGDVQVPGRMVVRPAVRTDNDEIPVPACVDQGHGAIEPGPATTCGEEQGWPPTDMAADEPAGEAVHKLVKPPVRRTKHGSRCLVHDAV